MSNSQLRHVSKHHVRLTLTRKYSSDKTLKVDQKHLESFEMWCWRRMKMSWTDHIRNEEVWQRVEEEWNILQTIKRRKANWIGHILRRNCFLKRVTERKIEGRIEVTGRRGRRRRKQLLGDLKEKRGLYKMKEEALDRTLWRTRFGRGYGIVREKTEWMNEWMLFTNSTHNECRQALFSSKTERTCTLHAQAVLPFKCGDRQRMGIYNDACK